MRLTYAVECSLERADGLSSGQQLLCVDPLRGAVEYGSDERVLFYLSDDWKGCLGHRSSVQML